jgi:hypothetical protein
MCGANTVSNPPDDKETAFPIVKQQLGSGQPQEAAEIRAKYSMELNTGSRLRFTAQKPAQSGYVYVTRYCARNKCFTLAASCKMTQA